ncbi:hypothetical protein MG068_08205 [Stenotrophomonas sp. ASS1]|uniref:hypothetical protein n=1 Tax=Stenotrophomonas sp. ASS1 TaxID=2282124 RepID=UPI00104BD6A7|nr:hypothetical protein [Stenotrophomonas sp. ASS1]QBL40491.1 hypothetical protein MG068_08205 [Stenotrophomonas sp. ASS1]
MKKISALGFLAVLAAGCSSTAVAPGTEKSVSAARVYDASYLESSPDRSATINVTRDKGFAGGGCSFDILIDNQKVVALKPGESASMHLGPGTYFLKLEAGGGLCQNVSTFQNVTVAAGDILGYRIVWPAGGRPTLERQ